MNTKLTPQEIKGLLNQSANQLDRSTTDKLYAARQHSLQNRRSAVSVGINPDGTLNGNMQLFHRPRGLAIAAIVAILLTLNLTYWYPPSERDHTDIDIAILTDDLPVDMYVD